ncbi:rhomboid family intramembrane serine protease [Marinobacterium aestuarii]|uniref:Rhomboid family intramembrane serine protease n=1 Tax=Marinobacterium aestuarii TaxID=1821621 RepID=A0A1A9EX55_9GAMM|nr:rhomboid family intramembrane serine protease [Marinobacterium aestuarii]ANG62330.1 rhomboid family intramembrane serine protease [Marinobacterium aestuarii]
MIKLLEVPLAQDLRGFTECLWQQRVPHRVVEQDAVQELWVSSRVDAEQVLTLYQLWREGADLSALKAPRSDGGKLVNLTALRQSWLSLLLIVASVLVSLLVGFGDNIDWMRRFALVDFQVRGDSIFYAGLVDTLSGGQLWRLFTPALMHFSLPHILFNLLWVWVAGRGIEYLHGRWALLGLVLFSALLSNLAQFWVSGPMFGGMSGVVFALLGYAWLWDRRAGRPAIGLPPALMGLMLLWLVLGFAGVLEYVGVGAIANTAHLAGLVAGLVWALLRSLFAAKRQA